MSLPASLLSAAARHPHKAFVETYHDRDGVSQSTTYSELVAAMLGAAAFLRDECKLQPAERIALLAHNSVAYLSMTLGTMCLGGVALHLNWRQPAAATHSLLDALAPRVLCASAAFVQEAREAGAREQWERILTRYRKHDGPRGW